MEPAQPTMYQPAPSRDPGAYRPAGAALPKLYRGRPWAVAFVAVLVELVVIAAVDNQTVTRILREPLTDRDRVVADYSRGAIEAATAYWWRFAPANGQATHVWAAQFAGIGALVLVTFFGVLAVARGSVSFGRVWVGVWAVITAIAPISIVVRNLLITPSAPGPAQSKIGQSIYGYDGFGSVVVAGLVLGVVTGLVAAAVATATRRHIAAAAPVERGTSERDEYLDESFVPRWPQPEQPYQPQPWAPEGQWATTQLPTVPAPAPTADAPIDAPTEAFAPGPDAYTEPGPSPSEPDYGWRENTAPTQVVPAAEAAPAEVSEPVAAAEPAAVQEPVPSPASDVPAEPEPSEPEPSEPEPSEPEPPEPGEQTRQLPRVPIQPDEELAVDPGDEHR